MTGKKKEKSLVDQILSRRPTRKKGRIEFLPTGCTVLDLTLGGGIPVGKMVNIVGDKSTGKTLVVTEFLVRNLSRLKDKFSFKYDDAEAGYNFNPSEIYGVDLPEKNFVSSTTIEEFEWNFDKAVKEKDDAESGNYFAYVVDSFDAIGSEDDRKKYEEKMKFIDKRMTGKKAKDPAGSFNMGKQKEIGNFFRLKCDEIKSKKICFIIISQVRENIGVMFGAKYRRNGGKALDFYASQVIWLAECFKMRREGEVVGVRVKASAKKNKVGLPFRECFFDILFDYGIDEISTSVNYLFDLVAIDGKDKKKISIEWDGKEYDREDFIKFVEDNNLENEINKRVIEKWKEKEEKIKTNRKNKYV